jgi:hypothetical protein
MVSAGNDKPGRKSGGQRPAPSDALDEALDDSFPASDPPAMTSDLEPGGPNHDPDEALRRKAAERAQVKDPRATKPGS